MKLKKEILSKSDRETLFISLLNGSYEDLKDLEKALELSGIDEKYRCLLTAKPIQAMDGNEAVQVLKEIAEDYSIDVSDKRMIKVAQSLVHTHRALIGIEQELRVMRDNHMHLVRDLQNYASSISNITGGQMPPYHQIQSSPGQYSLEKSITNMEPHVPKEGEKWE